MARIHDLSHTIIPGQEEYRLELDTRFTEQWEQFAQYQRTENQWYVISEVTFNTHVGTHIEFPYHHFQKGLDAACYPLESLIGDALVLDISRWGNNECIPLPDLQKIADNRIQKGDIVYFYTGFDRYYRTEKQHYRPWFATEAIKWLVSLGIKVMGVDTSGIEIRNPDGSASVGQPNHETLLGAGIALVEYMTNLAPLINKRFLTFILPVKLAGAEAFPVRVIGIETETDS
ncbi:MAG: cyclase family protein [Anaerolineales bacterium]